MQDIPMHGRVVNGAAGAGCVRDDNEDTTGCASVASCADEDEQDTDGNTLQVIVTLCAIGVTCLQKK